jgi:gamma-glutamyl-gamma-aminobutyrate hydrolase PuuD
MKIKSIIFSVIFAGCVCFAGAQQRPVIGLSDIYRNGGSSVPRSYVEAVLSVDGIPVIIPLMYEDDKIVELLKSLDGIIFTGGEDFDPSYYNEPAIPNMNRINAPRDVFDIKLLRLAVEHGIPVLGICRGVQLINIAYGGSLFQDLATQYPDKSIKHRQTQPKEEASHAVIVEEGTVFANIVKERMLMVNSSHHQSIKKLADGFRVAGVSPDKVIEAIEKVDSAHWIVGVQFHPEVMVNNNSSMRRIFKGFIDVTSRIKSGKQQPVYANIPDISVPGPDVIIRKDNVPEPVSNVDTADVKIPGKIENISDEGISISDINKVNYSDENQDKTDLRSSKERRREEMKKFREKEKLHDEEQKEKEKLEKKELKEKKKQEKEDFDKWVQQRKTEEKEQAEKENSAKKEAAEKEKQHQKELEEKTAKDKKELKEQAQQKKIAEKEQEEKEKSAKKEVAEKEAQRKKELTEKATKDKKELKEQARRKKLEEKERKKNEKAAKKEAEEKEKQYQREQKERAKIDKKELKKMEKQKKAEVEEQKETGL